MSYHTFTRDFELEGPSGDAVTYCATICAHPGRPGYSFGAPENCSPDEPADIEIMNVTLGGMPLEALNFTPAEIERIERWILEAAWGLPQEVLFGSIDVDPPEA
jgi:hypothetical protein